MQERQRILDEREARGITSNREQRFLAGAGPRREAPLCDPQAEMDPECEDFTSAAFSAALDAAFAAAPDGAVLGRQLRDIYREILHHRESVCVSMRDALESMVRHTERNARMTRVEKLRGTRLHVLVHIKNGHPNGFKSMAWMLSGREAPPEAAHAATLMRHDTERTKLTSQLEVSDTFVEAGTGLVRLLLGATPEERPGVLAALVRLHEETKRLLAELKAGKAGLAKRRAAARGGGGGKRKARKKASQTETSSDEGEEEEDDDDEDDEDDDDDE